MPSYIIMHQLIKLDWKFGMVYGQHWAKLELPDKRIQANY